MCEVLIKGGNKVERKIIPPSFVLQNSDSFFFFSYKIYSLSQVVDLKIKETYLF